MKNRCYNSNDIHYDLWGGRGIRVCDKWRESFENFLSDMGFRPIGMSLDRKNNEGNYEPNNCKWASREEQINNRRRTIRVRFPDREIDEALAVGCRRLGLDRIIIAGRIKSGWSLEEAISIPIKRYKKKSSTVNQ